MPAAETEPSPVSTPAAPARSANKRHIDEIVLVALLALSAVGFAISQISPRDGFTYWLAMVPVFGGISVYGGWSRARAQGFTVTDVLGRQLLHWSALAGTVCIVFLLVNTGRMNSEDASLVALLALALTTFLAGVHFDWRYCVVGALLAVAVVVVALIGEFLWVIVLVAVAAAAFLVVRARRGAGGDSSAPSV